MQALKRIIFCCVMLLLSVVGNVMSAQTVDTRIAVNSHTDDKTFVVIIANEHYKHEESVPFALNDGTVFNVYCQKTLGIPESNIHMIADATLNEMNYELYWLDEVLRAYEGDARAIVYYTGHGMPDEQSKEAYLLPVDGFSKSTSSALSTKRLYDKLGKMHTSSVMVFLDACFSGAKRDGKMLESSRGVAIKAKEETVGSNTVVFSAAQGDETAYPYNGMNHGLFTYYVLDKMQQSGGYTTMGELSDYVTREVKRKSVVVNGKSQTPSVCVASGNQAWRNWRLASVAAKRYETRMVASTVQSPGPAQSLATPTTTSTTTTAPATNAASNTTTDEVVFDAKRGYYVKVKRDATTNNATTRPSQSTTTSTTTTAPAAPKTDNAALNDLIEQGKKDMRAMRYESARKSLDKAARQGSIEAYYQLGLLYSNSNYDGYDRNRAIQNYEMAAQNNHTDAMYQAGMTYLGIDNNTAYYWFSKASENGHEKAKTQLYSLNTKGYSKKNMKTPPQRGVASKPVYDIYNFSSGF